MQTARPAPPPDLHSRKRSPAEPPQDKENQQGEQNSECDLHGALSCRQVRLPRETGIGRLHFPPHSHRAQPWRFRGCPERRGSVTRVRHCCQPTHVRIASELRTLVQVLRGEATTFVQFRFRRMRLPPLTEKAGRIADESLRPVSNNNVYLSAQNSRHPSRAAGDGADDTRANT
jgi:hypothetical protein